MIKVIQVIKNEKRLDKDGKPTKFNKTFYALELENGALIVFKPCFNEDYPVLDKLCVKKFVGFEKKKVNNHE